MVKGINISPLLNSNVVFQEFSFEKWPQTHESKKTVTVPYQKDFFDLRKDYHELFDKELTKSLFSNESSEQENIPMHKITYTINLLPSMVDQEIDLDGGVRMMDILGKEVVDFVHLH